MRKHETPRVAPGVVLFQEFEIADEVLVVEGDLIEFLAPAKKMRGRPSTVPSAGDDQVQWKIRGPIRSPSCAASRPVALSSTIRLGASGSGLPLCLLFTPLPVLR